MQVQECTVAQECWQMQFSVPFPFPRIFLSCFLRPRAHRGRFAKLIYQMAAEPLRPRKKPHESEQAGKFARQILMLCLLSFTTLSTISALEMLRFDLPSLAPLIRRRACLRIRRPGVALGSLVDLRRNICWDLSTLQALGGGSGASGARIAHVRCNICDNHEAA
jgi:hypothetical protein